MIGSGNGQKKSQGFTEFVLKTRQYLRDDLHLCEKAVQKILLYSNNFLHKKLKTEKVCTFVLYLLLYIGFQKWLLCANTYISFSSAFK